ncbi:hypothetical protein ACIAD1083 [Acinetobacter baylyi ADP1]|uniref:Uncharacterized protein n=1 Tax=Acinetobacter baylyi (strain ATCC 33305 / BD413 / ADP1) TaxID=62977 RepID=Q6FD90_ACIAD|nr:hypothetical protein ACIAD1083 [Acinetobacter baylyi ADP1]
MCESKLKKETTLLGIKGLTDQFNYFFLSFIFKSLICKVELKFRIPFILVY